jgi:hypothetical protein
MAARAGDRLRANAGLCQSFVGLFSWTDFLLILSWAVLRIVIL